MEREPREPARGKAERKPDPRRRARWQEGRAAARGPSHQEAIRAGLGTRSRKHTDPAAFLWTPRQLSVNWTCLPALGDAPGLRARVLRGAVGGSSRCPFLCERTHIVKPSGLKSFSISAHT